MRAGSSPPAARTLKSREIVNWLECQTPSSSRPPPNGRPIPFDSLKVKLNYKVVPDGFSSYLYSAMLNVQVALSTPKAPRTKRFEAIIDSGASRCMFDASIAEYLGIDLSRC